MEKKIYDLANDGRMWKDGFFKSLDGIGFVPYNENDYTIFEGNTAFYRVSKIDLRDKNSGVYKRVTKFLKRNGVKID